MKTNHFTNPSKFFLVILILVLSGTSCVPSILSPQGTPVIQTLEVTREVTREVTVEVTRDVTQIVEVPVTITPTATPEFTITPSLTPTRTPVSGPAAVQTLATAQCLFGPDPLYMSKFTLAANTKLEAVARSLDSQWVNVQTLDHKNPCWLKTSSLQVNSGYIPDLPTTDPVLSPYSENYAPPQAVSTNRVGNEVTIFWLPVPMASADYAGYLLEAWVCKGGEQVFVVKTHVPAYDKNQNNVMQAVLFVDEPGCSIPSRAVIYSVEKTGYSKPKNVPGWPSANITPTATP